MLKFTKLELDLINLIPFDQRTPERERPGIDTIKLVEKYFGSDRPLNARPIIISRLTGIGKKAELMDLKWRLFKTYRTGPIPQTFWREWKK